MSDLTEQVNELVDQMTKNDKGQWEFPKDSTASEELKLAARTERRLRDTHAAFHKSQKELKGLKNTAEALEQRILERTEVPLTADQRAELTELKEKDPEAWRAKLNEYETVGKQSLKDELAQIRKESSTKSEIEIRQEQMAAWSAETGIELNDEIVANELPPKFVKELQNGDVTFEQFLEKAGNFLGKKATTVPPENEDPIKDLNSVAGDTEPTKTAQLHQDSEDYSKTVF